MRGYGLLLLCLFIGGNLLACARSPVYEASHAMRPMNTLKVGADLKGLTELDDESWESLLTGLNIQIEYWSRKSSEEIITFGPTQIKSGDYLSALVELKAVAQTGNKNEFYLFLAENFELYQVYGGERWGQVLVTGYFEPVIKGSRQKTEEFSQPLYKVPKDFVNIDMSQYARTFPHWSPFEKWASEQKSPPGLIRGRLIKDDRGSIPTVVPYYSREEIDSQGSLNGQGLELVYVDPIEAFFLQIQGSGQIELSNKERLRVGYAAQNGHPYMPIGKFLKDHIPIEKMSLQSIEAHMRNQMNVDERQKLMNQNPSYVFFSPLKGKALTYTGTEVVDGRTIATDWRVFPKGTLAWLKFQKPKVNHKGEIDLLPAQRLVFDQDTGGAIRGTHRVDLFCGQGDVAKQMAGVMRHHGELIYLVPKKAARLSFVKNGPNGRN